ncbi:hypothetical protein IV203_013901 [Nitzschia inconspicua]|uniref:Uncharacterized protein n=1 Tax=Nitzschia inconspicua TaxID=303405 RepID=A0A9K3M9C9_9STRA|nr:hypothetical protein IV203_013901 [Nitzschia inconspicua]
MKVIFFLSAALLASAHGDCTHGRLFVSDADSTTVHVIDLNESLENLAPEASLNVPGEAGINLKATGSMKEVAAMYRGDETIGFTDGVVSFFDAGVSAILHGDHYDIAYRTPSMIENAGFECSRVVHYTPHADKIAFFCDGTYGDEAAGIDQQNSTVWVIDETKFGDPSESALVFNMTLQGSHHGVAIAVDDDHILYSLATPDRIARTPGIGETEALPSTFVIEDFEGNVIHNLDDTDDPSKSCLGFHGEWAHDNQFALGCDDNHGGILRVDYNPSTETYSSFAVSYPEGFEGHRTGSFAGHSYAEHIAANFAVSGGASHLLAFTTDDSQITENMVLPLPVRQCAFAYEQGSADHILVFLPTGSFHVFEYHDDTWEEKVNVQVVEGMTECSEALFVAGFGQAFVLVKESRVIHAIDLDHVDHGDVDIYTSTLGFTPFDAVVAGVPTEVACEMEGHEHEHSGSAAFTYQFSFYLLLASLIFSQAMV